MNSKPLITSTTRKKAIEAEMKRRGLDKYTPPAQSVDSSQYTPEYVKNKIAAFWKPHAGKQALYMQSDVYELFYGGAAGGGKTDCLLIDALEQVWHPRYNALIFRRTFTDLTKPDGIIARSKLYYPKLGGRYNGQYHFWEFPSGARIYFGGLEQEDDKYNYQGTQVQFLGFDELTQFSETQYLYLFSRVRLPDEREGAHNLPMLKLKVRNTSNPGGVGHDWVKSRFITSDIQTKRRFFSRIKDIDTEVQRNHPHARSRFFIFATHKDNPAVGKEYVKNLNQLPEVDRQRLLEGNWDAELNDGIYNTWSSRENVRQVEFDPAYTVRWSVDDGYSPNPRVILFIQERPYNGIPDCICVIDEICVNEELPETTIEQALTKPYSKPEIVIFDPSAKQFAATCMRMGLMTMKADNDVQEGIKSVRRFIKSDITNLRRLIVSPRCANLIREFPSYQQNRKAARTASGDHPPVKQGDHSLDALRYYIHTLCKFMR